MLQMVIQTATCNCISGIGVICVDLFQAFLTAAVHQLVLGGDYCTYFLIFIVLPPRLGPNDINLACKTLIFLYTKFTD